MNTAGVKPTALLDSDVLIDLSRSYLPALTWFSVQSEVIAVPGFVFLELLAGCRSKVETKAARTLIAPFPVLWLPEAELQSALTWYAPLPPANQIGVVDVLIAAVALYHSLPLLTFNVRHFAAVPGLMIQEPYAR